MFVLAFLASSAAAGDDDSNTLKMPDPLAKFDERQPRVFGEKMSEWWTVSAGAAYNFADSNDFNLRGAWSRFIIQDVELSLELNGWYFDQAGDNALGINPAFVFRWHLINKQDWTIYSDIGIGLLFTNDVVPEGGTSFDFTPRVGLGFTRRLDDDGDRLQIGVRWHHISNARIDGDSHNPARDALMLYAGVMFPF